MRTGCAVLAVLVASGAWAQGEIVKVFNDRGATYVRWASKPAPSPGVEIVIVADAAGSKVVGSALVLEVNGPLVRISLDDQATAAKARFARLVAPPPAAAPLALAAPPLPAVRPPLPTPTPPPIKPGPAALKGHLEHGPLRVILYNEGDEPWSECVLRYSNDFTYRLGGLAAHSEDSVMVLKFSPPPSPPAPPYDHVVVRCEEGETKFFFDNPTSPGALKGFVENLGGGRVMVHNTSEVPWNRCDVRKPDGSHFVIARLRAHDHESIRSVNFRNESSMAEPRVTSLVLGCKEGTLELPIP